MPTTSIVRQYPGRGATELFGALGQVFHRMAQDYGLDCVHDPDGKVIEVKEKLGVRGRCAVRDGQVAVELSHGLLGGVLAGQVKRKVEQELDGLFG